MEKFKSGFVSLIGRTNVGKSTLLNLLVGEKVSAIANKVQTTRYAIRGIVNRTNSQIVFVDTPGIHKPLNKLGNIFRLRGVEKDAISCYQTILENFSDTAYGPKARDILTEMGVEIKIPIAEDEVDEYSEDEEGEIY